MAKCFNPTCGCKNLEIVREIILRCNNCNCAVKVESIRIEPDRRNLSKIRVGWKSEDCERLLFTVLKNAK